VPLDCRLGVQVVCVQKLKMVVQVHYFVLLCVREREREREREMFASLLCHLLVVQY